MSENGTSFEDIEESEITSENGEMYLFQWLCATEKRIMDAQVTSLKANQSSLEASFLKVLLAPEPYPAPGRAIRNVAARCLISLYTRGETRSLFDTVQTLLKVVADLKSQGRDMYKIAAFSCIGDLMEAFGSQYMSFMSEVAMAALKTSKSSNSPLLRYHALTALRKALTTAQKAVTDNLSKDIFKQMRNNLIDKSLSIQRAAAEVFIAMYSDDNLPSVHDIENILTQSVKSLEHADQATRASLSLMAGHLLASTQIPRTVLTVDPPKPRQSTDEDDDEASRQGAVEERESKPLLPPNEMLARLSVHITKLNVHRKTRIGLFGYYLALFNKLGMSFVESNYAVIANHLLNDVVNPLQTVSNSKNINGVGTRYDTLLVRNLVGLLFRDLIGVRMLTEQAQISAVLDLSNSYLKRWPAMMPGQVAPNSNVLTIVLREISGLLQQLGNAPPPVQDAVGEPLITLLSHPSHTVRVNSAWALRCFCFSTPLRLPKTIITVTEMLQRDLTSLNSPAAPSDINLRSLGHAYGLAALVCIIPDRPLYVSYDVSAKVLDIAIQLLKRAGEHDVKVAGVEVEVAWTLIASLMSLGPNFVRPNLAQLLVLWRNALPKPTSKDNLTTRSYSEWMFLLHVRESALGAILCFLQYNGSTLVTLDVARRITSVLINALLFANNFFTQHVEDPLENQAAPDTQQMKGLSLKAREALLRRRVYQCFSFIGFSSMSDSTQTTLLQSVLSLFASPDGYSGSSVQAAIASGTFTSVWQSVDGYAYGVTSIELDGMDHLNRDTLEVLLDSLLRKPILGACEHDPLTLCQVQADLNFEYYLREYPPSATAVVDSAIDLFSQLLPLQDVQSTIRTITSLLESMRSNKLEKNAGRRAAVSVNVSIAIALALRNASSTLKAKEAFGNPQVTSLLSLFLKEMLIEGDHVLRLTSSESIGRLASLAGTNFLASQIKSLVDQVVNNRDPSARAGCALAFGSIYTYVGGMAAGPLLKTTVNILMSLSSDSHPIVHFHALSALASVINAASLSYSPFVSSTLGMLLKVYLMGSHEREGGSQINGNLSGDCPAYPVVCQIIDAVITILGPDMQESARTRTLVLNLVHEFSKENDENICVEALKCFQHFLMFVPEHVDIPGLVTQFRIHLSSSRRPLKVASINALYQLVQKDALAVSKLGGDKLVEELFSMLDDDSSVQGTRDVISSWLQQTVVYNPSAWIDLCQRIMSRTTASQQLVESLQDDEGQSLSSGMASGSTVHSTSRWRTQLFALQCLHQICIIVSNSGRAEHLDLNFAKSQNIPAAGLLVSRVPDLVKMAFTASAAYVTEIRLEGLRVLRDVIEIFATSPDPAFEDALLLEQHQAPITAALTPAFSVDSTPEILSSAVNICAVFVGCGVVKNVARMGRILKLLTTALDQSKDSGTVSLGETGELSPNGSAMLRISTLAAWAQLEVASVHQTYLVDVVKPYRAPLATLWVGALRDYASIRIDSEFMNDTSSISLDTSYSSLGKEVLLPYYADSWILILQAVAAAMQTNDPYIVSALDGKSITTSDVSSSDQHPRKEPAVFFFVLFGLIYETLSSTSPDSTSAPTTRPLAVITALQTLKHLLRPEYCGDAILEPTIFEEFIGVSYRMAMTDEAAVLIHLVEVLIVFATTQEKSNDNPILDVNSPRAHCLRICAYILRHSTTTGKGPVIHGSNSDRTKLISSAFTAFVTIAGVTNSTIREDFRSVAILLYSELLKDETLDIDLVGPTLPSLKSLLSISLSQARNFRERYDKTVHGIFSSCLLNIDEMRGRSGLGSTKKVQNNLLASVLILTVVPSITKVSEAAVEHCCFLITEHLLDMEANSLTAIHCAKTLVSASVSGSPILQQCTRLLIPGLIEYIAKVAPTVNDGTVSEIHVSAVGEVWRAFSSFYTSVAEEHRTRLLGILLPTITLLLSNSQTPAIPVVAQSVLQLLSYATISPVAFKEAAAKLDVPTRELLENSVRRAVAGNTMSGGQTSKPQISLRSF